MDLPALHTLESEDYFGEEDGPGMSQWDDGLVTDDEVVATWQALPRLLFLDTCTLQWLHDYGGYMWDEEAVDRSDRIHQQGSDGLANLEALRRIMAVSEHGACDFAVSERSMAEVSRRGETVYRRWALDVLDYWHVIAEEAQVDRTDPVRVHAAARLSNAEFGYLAAGDRAVLRDAIWFGCDGFLTVEKKLPRNAHHLRRATGLQVVRPVDYWSTLEPWAALYM